MMFAILYGWQRLFEGGLRSRCSTTSMLRLGFDRQYHFVFHLVFPLCGSFTLSFEGLQYNGSGCLRKLRGRGQRFAGLEAFTCIVRWFSLSSCK